MIFFVFILKSDLKTVSNQKTYIIEKAFKRMWIIWRLKVIGASRSRLLDVLQKEVLSVLQLAVPAWDCFLTGQERTDLERVIQTGLRIIWGQDYMSFEQVLQETQTKILRKFVRKSTPH